MRRLHAVARPDGVGRAFETPPTPGPDGPCPSQEGIRPHLSSLHHTAHRSVLALLRRIALNSSIARPIVTQKGSFALPVLWLSLLLAGAMLTGCQPKPQSQEPSSNRLKEARTRSKNSELLLCPAPWIRSC